MRWVLPLSALLLVIAAAGCSTDFSTTPRDGGAGTPIDGAPQDGSGTPPDGGASFDGGADAPPPLGRLGVRCRRGAECESGLCVTVSASESACSAPCEARECLPGWGCAADADAGAGRSVCMCEAQPEICNGLDDDCDGVSDDGAGAALGCAPGEACTAGTCACPASNECDGRCVDTSSDRRHCGSCGHACAAGEACGSGSCCPAAGVDLDLLFVIDNSNSMAEEQSNLAANFPRLVRALATGDLDGDGRPELPPVPSLHVGVVTTDMGTVFPVPTCSDDGDPDGDDAILRTAGNTTLEGCAASYPSFLAFAPAADDPDVLAQSLACVALAGTGGCGFEQQLEAPLKALTPSGSPIAFATGHGHGDAENAGFLRPDSVLAIVLATDEEDCSARDTAVFDPRSTRFGEELNLRCYRAGDESLGALQPVSRYVDGLRELRPGHPERLVFAAIAGVPPGLVGLGYDAMLDAPEMQETIDPADPNRLMPSCNVPGLGIAFPPRRIVRLARDLGPNTTVQSICQPDFTPALDAILRVLATPLGGACLL